MRVGIITGSGTYAMPDVEHEATRSIATRFGTVELAIGSWHGVEVAHLSRHGVGHARLSNQVNHRANVLALREHAVDAVLAVTVCGAVDPSLELGSLVVFDDLHFLANRLADGSICTLHDQPGSPGRGHWVFERPFSEQLRRALLEGAASAGLARRDGGCYGHVDGPRFNTRAEIRMLASCGVSAVSQTAGPEAVLCGEAELPYALLGYVTDYANGVVPEPTPVSELRRLIGESGDAFTASLAGTLPLLPAPPLAATGAQIRWP